MALLTEAQRKAYFKALGLGEYNKTNILKVQKKYLLRKSDWDGVYGTNTDNLIRHLKAVKDNTKNFAPEEFRCGCNGRYCCGYPTWMKPAELANVQSIRTHFAKPMVVTCGVRCPSYNREVGGITNSEHLYGSAVDYYIAGVTDTLGNRKANIGWISTLPNHHYTYGNGIFVETANGNRRSGYVSAPGMGNAMHTDSYNGEPVPAGKLIVDGIGGASTVRRMQEFFGTGVDGVISGQNKSLKKYYTSLTSVTFGGTGSACIKKLQKWVGAAQDGVLGQKTVKAWQKKIGVTADGYFNTNSMKAWQKYLNDHDKPVYPPAPTPSGYTKMIDVSEFQPSINWNSVKAAGVKGAIVRCGFRGYEKGTLQEDSKFMEYIKGAHAAGIPVGIYFFTQAINAAEGKEEADYTIKLWKKSGVPISFPIAIDTEHMSANARANNLTKAQRTAAVKGFCDRIKKLGYTPMIYASTSWLNNDLDMSKLPYDVWCAQYYSECQYKGKYVIWQYTSEGSVNGIKGVVDMNRCYIQPKKVDPPKNPEKKGYDGKYPTAAQIKAASNFGIRKKVITWCKKIADSGKYGYKQYTDDPDTHKCPICHKGTGNGWNCIGYAFASLKHGGGIPCKCSCDVVYNGLCDRWVDMTTAEVLASMKSRIGVDDIKAIRNGNRAIPASMLGTGDLLYFYNKDDTYQHMGVYVGNDKIADCTNGRGQEIVYGSSYDSYNRSMPCLFAIRYTGGHAYLSSGDKGTAVTLLQKYMIWGGWLAKGEDDGIFGAKTETAAKKMQKVLKVTADGMVGTNTFKAMKSYKK